MTRPHLDAPRAAILARLQAGQTPDHIATVGAWLGAWTRADVENVRGWLRRDADSARTRDYHRGGPGNLMPIAHGEYRGYQAHRRRGIPTTPECGCDEAARQARLKWKKRTA